MNDVEYGRWADFCREHKSAKERYYKTYTSSGIGSKIIAVAKYTIRKVELDITD